MNNLKKAYIKGLVKEAAGLSDIKNKLMEFYSNTKGKVSDLYQDNKEVIDRVGIDTGAGLLGAGISAGADKLRGKPVSILRMLLSGATGVGLAEAGQYGYKKYTGLKNDLADTETKLNTANENIGALTAQNKELEAKLNVALEKMRNLRGQQISAMEKDLAASKTK